jgi:four helix bundle protein
VPTNIAEGSKRLTAQEYSRFLNIAEASLAETEYLLMVSRDLGYITTLMADKAFTEVSELSRMLHGLRKKVESTTSVVRTGVRPN